MISLIHLVTAIAAAGASASTGGEPARRFRLPSGAPGCGLTSTRPALHLSSVLRAFRGLPKGAGILPRPRRPHFWTLPAHFADGAAFPRPRHDLIPLRETSVGRAPAGVSLS